MSILGVQESFCKYSQMRQSKMMYPVKNGEKALKKVKKRSKKSKRRSKKCMKKAFFE